MTREIGLKESWRLGQRIGELKIGTQCGYSAMYRQLPKIFKSFSLLLVPMVLVLKQKQTFNLSSFVAFEVPRKSVNGYRSGTYNVTLIFSMALFAAVTSH